MDISKLVRDASKITPALSFPRDADIIVATKPLKIHVPKRYSEGSMGSMEERVTVMGLFAYIVDDAFYAVSNTLASMSFTPDTISIVNIDDSEYLELSWDAGSVVCPNTNLVQNKSLAYELYNEIESKGKTPWYVGYRDLCGLFDTSKKHANVNLGVNHAILEIFPTSRARNPQKRTQYIRELFKTQDDFDNLPRDYIPQKSVAYGATNTTARLLGSYLKEGMTSALVNPSETTESIEELLRA